MSGTGRRLALITGASAGIGAALAEVYAETGHDLVLVARRKDRLDALAGDLEARFGIQAYVAAADLADPLAPQALKEWIDAQGLAVDALVNNAGYGLSGQFLDRPWSDYRDFVQVMGTALLELCHVFVPPMRARGYGRVLNVASVAAYFPGTVAAGLYSGVKALVVKASEELALELQGSGVHVTALCPGLTHSDFHAAMGEADRYARIPSWLWMDARTVALHGFDAVMRGDRVAVPGAVNKLAVGLTGVLPAGLVARASRAAREPGGGARE